MSTNFNYWEKIVARMLSKLPTLKKITKSLYSYLFFLLKRKRDSFKSIYRIRSLGEEDQESFFGYYDKSPINKLGNYIIFQQTNFSTRQKPDLSQHIEVILQDYVSRKVIDRLISSAYNWQQGTKLQWLSNTHFVFNDFDHSLHTYVAKIYNAESKTIEKTLPVAIYDCFGDEFALTLNYDRLARLSPDYGYFNRLEQSLNIEDLENDGVFKVNMQSGKCELLISLLKLANLYPKFSMKNAKHTVNHIMISPNGKEFMVIHRWYKKGRRFDRLVLANTDGSELKVLADNNMVSHCFWVDVSLVMGYLRGSNGKDGYWLINTKTLDRNALEIETIEQYGDGHCHVNGDWFVTDTYPDKARMQHLFLCNWKTGEFKELGEFFHGFRFNQETRCDLHPRLSPDGRTVFFDSVFTGKRRMYSIDLTQLY